MRVTANSTSGSLLQHINDLAQRQSKLQGQIASGQKIQRAEDNPLSIRRLMRMDAEASATAQFQKNVGREQDRSSSEYSALRSLKKISDRAGEIAVLADDLKSPAELADLAGEVTQMIKQAVQVANAKHEGTSLFAGTKSDQNAYSISLAADGSVAGYSYHGNEQTAFTHIGPGMSVASQAVGSNTTGTQPRGVLADAASGADLIGHLISLQNNLKAGNAAAIATTDRPNLAMDEENIIFHIGRNGIKQSQLQTTSAALNQQTSSLEQRVSKEADVDLAEVLVKLSATQTAYQAALQSGAKLMDISLMNFLR